MSEVIYKSKYSLICELTGHPKPATQEEENYCQLVEFQNESTSIPVQIRLLTEYINKLKKYVKT